MAKNPSTRWYFNDWDNDKGLQACGFAAQGFWMRLLGICAENGGYLLFNGKPPSIRDLAVFLGKPHGAISRLLHELEEHIVFSRTPEGVIFCRRMVRQNGMHKRRVPPKKTDGERDANQPELFDNPTPKSPKPNAPLDSGTFGASPDSPISEQPTSLPDAASAPAINSEVKWTQESSSCANGSPSGRDVAPCTETGASNATTIRSAKNGEKSEKGNPEGARCARLDGSKGVLGTAFTPIGNCSLPRPARPACDGRPRPPPKTPALKAKIRDQLVQKHARFLTARKRPEEVAAYWTAMLDDDPAVAQRMFDATDARMRRANWDDMRQWKDQHGIAA